LNLSNHKFEAWSQEQRREAEERWGYVEDFPFPAVPASMDEKELYRMAVTLVDEIIKKQPDAIMCQGEFTLTFALVRLFQKQGIPVVSACTERSVTEKYLEDGTIEKKSVFRFVRFRAYCS